MENAAESYKTGQVLSTHENLGRKQKKCKSITSLPVCQRALTRERSQSFQRVQPTSNVQGE